MTKHFHISNRIVHITTMYMPKMRRKFHIQNFGHICIHLTLTSTNFPLFTSHFPFLPKTRFDTISANTLFGQCSDIYFESLCYFHSHRHTTHIVNWMKHAYNIVPNSTSVMLSFCTLCWFVFRTFRKFPQWYIVADVWWHGFGVSKPGGMGVKKKYLHGMLVATWTKIWKVM